MLPCTFPARDFSRVLLCVPLQEVQCGTHIYTHTQPCSVACVIGAHSTRTQLVLLLAPSSESCVWAIASACVFERSCAVCELPRTLPFDSSSVRRWEGAIFDVVILMNLNDIMME